MQKYSYVCWIHTDAMNNRRRKTSLAKYIPLTLFVRVRKGLIKVCVWEGVGDRTETAIFWPQIYGRHVVFFLFFWCLTGALGSTLLGAGFLYCILSTTCLDPNSSGPQALSAWCGFPYHISTPTGLQLYWLVELNWRYIIVRRPLDLWNLMFNRHQAEITVRQFRGHSLPVQHSVVAQWDLHHVPYYQP